MGTGAILISYQSRIVALHATASHLRVGQMIALGLMLLALAVTLVLGVLSMTKRNVLLPSALIPVAVALYAGSIFRRRNEALLKTLRLKTHYQRGVERLEGRWPGKGPDGEEFVEAAHLYQRDLQVIGDGSLFQFLCTTRTQVGRRRLADYLLVTPGAEEMIERQAAVRELQNEGDLRERIALVGDYSFQEASWNAIVDWLESPATPVYRALQGVALGASASLGVLLLLVFLSAIAWSQVAVWIYSLLLLNAGLGWCYRSRVLNAMPAIRALGLEIGTLREGVSLLRTQRFKSALLARIVTAASDGAPMKHLRKLERLTRVMTERDKEWFYVFSRGLLIGTQTFLLLERWRSRHGDALRRWAEAWGEFEALMALGGYASEHPDSTFPEFSLDQAVFEGKGIQHPLLPAGTCVPNDISLHAGNRFYVISGSNMAGKSTLLRTIGLNAVLAYAGAPVAAKYMTLSRFTICASLNVQDSLLDGKSKFLAELDRLKQAWTVPPQQRPVLFLIDEILAGTNSNDRRAVAEAILKALMKQGAMGSLSTHDLALTDLATSTEWHGTNAHMASEDDADPLKFDYILKAGPATQSNAIAIARLAGLAV